MGTHLAPGHNHHHSGSYSSPYSSEETDPRETWLQKSSKARFQGLPGFQPGKMFGWGSPPKGPACVLLLSWGSEEAVFSSRVSLQEKAADPVKKLPDGVVSTWSNLPTLHGYVMDTHVEDPAFPMDYDSVASAYGGVSVGCQSRGPFNTRHTSGSSGYSLLSPSPPAACCTWHTHSPSAAQAAAPMVILPFTGPRAS